MGPALAGAAPWAPSPCGHRERLRESKKRVDEWGGGDAGRGGDAAAATCCERERWRSGKSKG